MSLSKPDSFSDYLVFVDESGDHGMTSVNRDFPLFALAFCVFSKPAYVDEVTPALRRLKVATFGHDLVVLHEHDIRKKEGAMAILEGMLERGPDGRAEGYGLKCFPEKNEGPPGSPSGPPPNG